MSDLVYTQRSVAFPILGPREGSLDDIDLYGPKASIQFDWIKLGSSHPNGALQIRSFTDSLPTLLDPRVQRVLARIKRQGERNKEITPSVLIRWLEDEGAVPLVYHLRGLDTGNLSLADKAELQRKIEVAGKRDGR